MGALDVDVSLRCGDKLYEIAQTLCSVNSWHGDGYRGEWSLEQNYSTRAHFFVCVCGWMRILLYFKLIFITCRRLMCWSCEHFQKEKNINIQYVRFMLAARSVQKEAKRLIITLNLSFLFIFSSNHSFDNFIFFILPLIFSRHSHCLPEQPCFCHRWVQGTLHLILKGKEETRREKLSRGESVLEWRIEGGE